MAAESEQSLENLLNKATNPVNRDEDWDFIMAFCDQVNKELEGPQISLPLIAHKIQSPQEQEALLALSTLEACVKNCGRLFHQELGKFRFLNEMIKVVSPKYYGNRTTAKVKKKCIELIYNWSKGLPHEQKILEAYKMLKQQGIVKEDPENVDQTLNNIPPPKPRQASFEDEEKAKLLSKLLKSKNPNDLQAANRLIKNMVKQDESKMEKMSRRINELKTINNNVKLLNEMICHYRPQTSSKDDKEMMKELYESLEKLRPNLFRLASDADEKDNDGIAEILKTNDEVMKVMASYKKTVEPGVVTAENGETNTQDGNMSALLDLALDPSSPQTSSASHFIPDKSVILQEELQSLGIQDSQKQSSDDLLADLDDIFSSSSQTTNVFQASGTAGQPVNPMAQTGGVMPQMVGSMTGGFTSMSQAVPQPGPAVLQAQQAGAHAFPAIPPFPQRSNPVQSPLTMGAGHGALTVGNVSSNAQVQQQKPETSKAMADLDLLGQNLMQQSLSKDVKILPQDTGQTSKLTLNQMASKSSSVAIGPSVMTNASLQQPVSNSQAPIITPLTSQVIPQSSSAVQQPSTSLPMVPPPPGGIQQSPAKIPTQEILTLTDIFVPLETIQPSSSAPVNAYDKNGLKIVIHAGKDRPREDVSVTVVSIISTNPSPVKKFTFQAAVPKVMKVKLQPPSATDLPAYNPILPPSAITQVMLFANPQKENIRLKFKIMYVMNDEDYSDFGEVDNFTVR